MDYGGDMRIEILVKELRKNNNFTLEQLAEKTGVSKTHINDIENGLKEPGLSVLVRLAKALDVQVTELYRVIWR